MSLSENAKKALKKLKQKKQEPTILTSRDRRIYDAFGIPRPPIVPNISDLLKIK